MLTVSNELKNAFMKAERTIYVRVKIGNRTFYNDNVISVEYDSGSLSGEVFAIGSTYSNSIKITFSDLVEGLKELDEVTYEIGIKLPNGTIEYVPMGVFIINDAIKMDRNNNKTTIECMDKMVMMGGTYVSSLTYPAAIREVALEIANKAGVGVDSTTFARLSADKIAKPEGYTYREAIGLIAQFEAGFATFNRFGKLEIRTLVDPNFAIPPDNYFSKGLVKNEVFFRLGGISCTTDDGDTIIQSGNSAGNQVVLENRVMTKVLLDKIYQKIQTINYYPFSLSWQGNPVIEAGDWVEVEDLQGNKFKTPNLSYSLSFNGGLSAKSSAETVTQSDVTYQYKSPLQQKIEWIHARIDAAGGNVVFVGIDTPTNPKEGDLWFKVIGPDKEILIYRKREDGTLFWDPQISTADINKVAKELESIIKQADLDRAKTEQDFESGKLLAKQYTDTEVLKFDTKFTAETSAIRTEIQTGYTNAVTAGKAYTDTKSNEFNSQLGLVKTDVANTVLKADAAVLKADKAISDAGFAKVDADTAKQNALTAIGTANTAKTNADTALGKANTAITNSGTALSTAQTAITNSGTAVTNAQNALNAYNNLEIGGRNLILKSAVSKILPVSTSNHSYLTIVSNEIFVEGQTYTFSSDIEKLAGTFTQISFLPRTINSAGGRDNKIITIVNNRIVVSFVAGANEDRIYVYAGVAGQTANNGMRLFNYNLVKGNKATDWTPAPEDVQVQITDINGELARKVSQTTFDTLNGVVGTHTTQIGQTQIALTAKADSQLVNTIKGTVDKHTLDIAATSQGLTFKADSSLVDTIKGTVDKHTLDIAATNQGLSFKADSSRVDTIKGTVDNHTTELGIQAQAITARLTSAQVDSLVAGKNFVNQTALNATSSQWNLALTQVSTDLSNLEIGGQNYFKKSTVITQVASNVAFLPRHIETPNGFRVTGLRTGVIRIPNIVTQNGWWTVSFDMKGSQGVSVDMNLSINGAGTKKVQTNNTNTYQRYSLSFNITNISSELNYIEFSNIQNAYFWIDNIKVEKGQKATDWSPAPEDQATLEQFTTLDLKVNGIQTTVGNKADKTQVTQLATQWTQTTELVTGHTSQIGSLGTQVDLRVVKGDVIGQITVEAGKTLIKNGQLLLDADTYIMGTTFANDIKAKSLESVYADIATLRTKFLIADLITSAYLKVDNALVDKMTATTSIVDRFFSKTAVIDNIETKSLAALYADIPTIRNKVLITDSVTSGMVKADAGLFDKVFINDAVVQKLTVKASFINSVKAIEITADRVNGGTANFANFNVINFNANNITSGSLNGANYSNNLNTGVETFRNPSNGSTLSIQQDKFYFNTSGASHYLIPDNEGLAFVPASGNTGNNRNAGIRLQSTNFNFVDLGYGSDGGFLHRVGSYPDTMAFINKDGGGFTFSHTGVLDVLNANTRRWDMTIGLYGQFKYGKSAIQFNGYDSSTIPKVKIVNPSTGALATLDVGYINLGNQPSSVELSNVGTSFKIEHVAGRNWVFADGLNGTLTYGITRLALNGHNNASARLSVYGAGGTSYGYMSAANFDVQSERKYKDNIVDFNGALGIIATMQIHQYDKNGISEIGIITDEAPDQLLADNGTKVSLYDYASLAVKGVQELDRVVWVHEVRLSKHDQEIKDLKEKIKQLESIA